MPTRRYHVALAGKALAVLVHLSLLDAVGFAADEVSDDLALKKKNGDDEDDGAKCGEDDGARVTLETAVKQAMEVAKEMVNEEEENRKRARGRAKEAVVDGGGKRKRKLSWKNANILVTLEYRKQNYVVDSMKTWNYHVDAHVRYISDE